MRLLQRLSAAIGWAMVLALAVTLILEATELISGEWRIWVADALDGLANPTMPGWAAALIAVAIALAALATAAAQTAPYRLSSRQSMVVDRMPDGDLVLHSRAIQSALQHLLKEVDGVFDVRVVVEKRRLVGRVSIEDSTNLSVAVPAARALIDDELWPHIGIEPRPINLEFIFGRAPARVVN